MTERELNLFKALNTVRYGRSNLLAAYLGGSAQNRKRELSQLMDEGLLYRPEHMKDNGNWRYSAYIYGLTPKAQKLLTQNGVTVMEWDAVHKFKQEQFWHRVMIADIVLSFMIEAKKYKLPFKSRLDLIGTPTLSLPCEINFPTDKGAEPYTIPLRSDELCAIGDFNVLLEADRHTERIDTNHPKVPSYKRKILQYRHVYQEGLYKKQWGLKSVFTIHITVSNEHSDNIVEFMSDKLQLKSRGQLFAAFPSLGDKSTYPSPINLLEHPFKRVGFEPLIIGKEIFNGHSSATKAA